MKTRNRIANIFLTVPDKRMYGAVLKVILKALKSKYGLFGYIDDKNNLVCPSLSMDVWEKCKISNKDIIIPRKEWGNTWGRVLVNGKSIYSNIAHHVPKGHLPIRRSLLVPIPNNGKCIGLLAIANKKTDYTDKDKQLMNDIAGYIGPVLGARLQRDRQETKRNQAEASLKDAESRYRTLVEYTPAVIWIVDVENFLYINPAGEKFTGYDKKKLYSMKPIDMVHPDMRAVTLQHEKLILKGKNNFQHQDIKLTDQSGAIKWLEYTASLINYNGKIAILGSGFDITSRKAAENTLKRKKQKLIKQTKHLAELNTALKVLIEHREEEKQQLKDNIQATINKLIFPYLEKLEHAKLTENDKTLLKIIRSNLKEVLSPFANTLHLNTLPLTPTEIQVADLIKQGKSNKEMASFLYVSCDTVSFHRKNIRKKLDLTHSKINLRTYLHSLP